MTEFTERHEELLRETRDTVIKISTVLLGANGNPGLASKVDEVCQSHYKLKRNFAILVSFLIGSGILGTSIWSILNF